MTQAGIMVVEDEAMVALDIQATLRRLGYRVLEPATSGAEALRLAEATRPDLVLIDIALSEGLEQSVARALERTLHIPVIYLAAPADEPMLQRAAPDAPYRYLRKPCEERTLQRTIEAALRQHRAEQQLRHVERWLGATLATIDDAVIVADADERIVLISPSGEALTGWSRDEALGQPLAAIVRLAEQPLPSQSRPPQPNGSAPPAAQTLLARDGRAIPVEARVAPLHEDDGRSAGLIVVVHDRSAQIAAETALHRSEERYALAALGVNDGLWDWEIAADRVYFSARWKAMLGYADDEIGTTIAAWFERVHPDDEPRLKAALEAHLAGREPEFEAEHRMRHRDGSYRWMLSRGHAARDAAGRAVRIAGSQSDISARKTAEARLQHDALHDTLTGLPNRALFIDRLTHAVQHARRHPDHRFAVLILDLDRFKHVNDSLGHSAGDALLVAFAQRLGDCLRGEDTVARIGGDEFTILLDGIESDADATRVANRIQQDLQQPFKIGQHDVYSSASIGIVINGSEYEQPDTILRDADLALYRAKAQGRARFAVFDQAMHAHAVAVLELEADLRRALERNEFVMYYQPIISLQTGRIMGFEALVRWNHPRRGLVVPDVFIPLAEETGLIMPLGWWVLREACRQTQEWQARLGVEPPLTVSVNLSGKQFVQPDCVAQISAILLETGLDPRQLRVELTESVIMEHTAAATDKLAQLREMGVQLHMDDFGTGYSSLSSLHHLPIDALKIDRSFVSRMRGTNENSAIVNTIVALARHLGMGVIAEGIEVAEQLAILRALDCDHAQGFLFSRPLDSAAAGALIVGAPHW